MEKLMERGSRKMKRESKIWEANKTSKDERDDIGVKRRKTKLWNIYTFFYIKKKV